MFEKASEIRAAQMAKMVERARNKGREEGRKEGRKELHDRLLQAAEQLQQRDPQTGAIILTPEVMDYLFGESTDRDD